MVTTFINGGCIVLTVHPVLTVVNSEFYFEGNTGSSICIEHAVIIQSHGGRNSKEIRCGHVTVALCLPVAA